MLSEIKSIIIKMLVTWFNILPVVKSRWAEYFLFCVISHKKDFIIFKLASFNVT